MQNSRQPALRLLQIFVLLAVSSTLGAAEPPVRVEVRAQSFQPGELVLATITAPEGTDTVTISIFGDVFQAVHDPDRRWRALAGIDLDQAPGKYELSVEVHAGGRTWNVPRPLLVRPRSFPTRRLTVDPDFVNPPRSMHERIEHESQLLRDAYARSSREPLWRLPFVRPVPGPAISRFGTRSVFNGEARNPHTGVDFRAAAGTPVKAPNAGRVVLARELFFSGNTVLIDHGAGLLSLLAHLSRIDVAEGDAVQAGQVVGLVGATGRVTGPHLHWSLRAGGARVDPTSALALIRTSMKSSGF